MAATAEAEAGVSRIDRRLKPVIKEAGIRTPPIVNYRKSRIPGYEGIV